MGKTHNRPLPMSCPNPPVTAYEQMGTFTPSLVMSWVLENKFTPVYCFCGNLGLIGGEFCAKRSACHDKVTLHKTEKWCVLNPLWNWAQAQTNAGYCCCTGYFFVGSLLYTLLLTESDIFIKMMEELVLYYDFLLCIVILRKQGVWINTRNMNHAHKWTFISCFEF